jgi:hypothetical protein
LGPTTDIYQGEKLLVRKGTPPELVPTTVEISKSPVGNIQSPATISFPTATVTSFPTTTFLVIESQTVVIEISRDSLEGNSMTGMAIGITLVAILFAGLFSWISSRRSA